MDEVKTTAMRQCAIRDQLSRDLFWTFVADKGLAVRWVGYDDAYWWHNAPDLDLWRVQEIAGTRYTLDARTNEVQIEAIET